MRSRNALETISRSCRRPVVGVSIVAVVLFLALMLPSTQVQSAGNLGGARLANVVGVGGACVDGPNGNAVEDWEVAEGQSYVVTLSNVLDCATGGTEATIQVMVKNTDTGNVCYTAQKQSTGVYTFTVNIPNPACNTFPILYCTTNCDASTGFFVRRQDGGNFQAHLRAATFDGNCNVTGLDTDCGGGGLKGAISACKFYDFNANGLLDPTEVPLDGWPMTINPLDGAIPQTLTQLTVDGCVSWANLDPAFNPYSITEGTPNELNWVHSTPNPVTPINVVNNQVNDVLFGNYCTVPSGGLTLGFWSNKNGQAILAANDPAWRNLLNGCCLRKADGTDFDISLVANFATAYGAFRTWILGANATNMSYMLSAQLAAMKLNIAFGSVNGTSFDLCSGGTINQLTIDANALLCADGFTPAGDPNRAPQEAKKNCLDALNNGAPVIPATPCSRTFPTQ